MAQKRKDKAKKRVVKIAAVGQAHIKASFNNVIISMTNEAGQVITWATAGKMGFRVLKRILRMQPKLQLVIALKKRMTWVFVK